MARKGQGFWRRWKFPILLGVGYLADGIVVFIFFIAGANSGSSFAGDGAGGIGLVYAATIFLPHMLLFFFSLVAVTILAIILWRELGLRSRLLLAFYYLLTALILWSNFASDGGIAVRYAARKLFAPGYYAAVTPDSLDSNSSLRRLLRRYDREASAFYSAKESGERRKHYIALRFWRICIQRHLETNGAESYDAFDRTDELASRLFRSHVHTLADAALEEHPCHMQWSRREKLEEILRQLAEGRDDDHPDPCKEEPDTREIHRLVYRGGRTIGEAIEKWSFILRRDSRDLLALDADRILVADGERGIELWHRTKKGWRYLRTLCGEEGAIRLLRRGEKLYALLHRINRGYFLARFRFDSKEPSLVETSRIRMNNGGNMRDWDADASGEHLFLAAGYSGVLLVDFSDPEHPTISRASGLGSRNASAKDLLWDEKRRRLYCATNMGLQSCILDSAEKLVCKNYFSHIYDDKYRRRLINGVVHYGEPIEPNNLLGVVALDSRLLLGIDYLVEKNATSFSLYDRNVGEGEMPEYLGKIELKLPMTACNHLSASYPQNALCNGCAILMPTMKRLAVIAPWPNLRGCLETGAISRFIPLGGERIIAAQRKEGIREWKLPECISGQKSGGVRSVPDEGN